MSRAEDIVGASEARSSVVKTLSPAELARALGQQEEVQVLSFAPYLDGGGGPSAACAGVLLCSFCLVQERELKAWKSSLRLDLTTVSVDRPAKPHDIRHSHSS